MLIIVRRGGSYMSEELEEVEGPADSGAADTGSAALSLALGRTGKSDKALDEDARAFLKKQGRLIDLQTEHLHEQREIVLSRLRWGRFSDRMKALLQVMTACIGLAIAGGIGWMAWSASQDRGLVIEPFSVPPDLAQKGLTGQVVASMLLDKLGEMQNATVSARAPSTYANNWNDQIKVEIPETGVSVGELQRLLVQWLGHQTSISGELYRTPAGLALAARTGTAPAQTHPGAETDIDKMVQAAAEDVYATTQPYRYAIWLAERAFSGPTYDEALSARAAALMQRLVLKGDPVDRIWASAGLSSFMLNDDYEDAVGEATTSLQLEPRFSLAYANRADAYSQALGHDEAALADYRKAVATLDADGRRFFTPEARAQFDAYDKAHIEAELGDWAGAARDAAAGMALEPGDEDARQYAADAQALAHQIGLARQTAAGLTRPNPSDSPLQGAAARGRRAAYEATEAYALGDWARIVAERRQIDPTALPSGIRHEILIGETPLLALAMAQTGDVAGARTLIATTPADCYPCVRMRGRIEAAARNWPEAERWFAEAVRQAPSLPFAYAEWGRALLDKGDTAGALAKAKLAIARGPRFPDAWLLEGEALMALRDGSGAAKAFAQADAYAPRWGRNHMRWGLALMMTGSPAEARRQFQAAGGMEMSPADRAALNVLLARSALHG